jgi:hypothetical protein
VGIERKDEWTHRWYCNDLGRHITAALTFVNRLRTVDPDRAARIETLLAEVMKEVEGK